MTILLIEDDYRLADLIQFKLSDYNIIIGDSLAAAKKILSSISPTLLLVDLNLPDSRGLQTLVSLKSYNIPKIVVSGSLDEEMCRALDLGATDYICKGYNVDDMVARIRFNLAKYRTRPRFSAEIFKEVKAHFSAEMVMAIAN